MAINTTERELWVQLSEGQNICFASKIIDEKEMVDIRKWFKWPSSPEFFPSKKGICFASVHLPMAIEQLQQLQ